MRTCFEKTGRNEFVGIISQTLPLVWKTCATNEIRKNRLKVYDETVPEGEIQEGGGLGNLRRRVEEEECRMEIRSSPVFSLTVDTRKPKEP